MKRIINYLNVFLFFLMASALFTLPAVSYAKVNNSQPVALLQTIATDLIHALKANRASLKANRELVYSLATNIVVPHADFAEMSKRVIPPSVWQHASAEQRTQFQTQFMRLLVRTYATALAEYKDETIRFYPVRGGAAGKSNVSVSSQIIRSDGPAIPITYRLVMTNEGWKLYDMAVEGVSMLESFRSQFADKLARGNMSALIQELSAHNARVSRR